MPLILVLIFKIERRSTGFVFSATYKALELSCWPLKNENQSFAAGAFQQYILSDIGCLRQYQYIQLRQSCSTRVKIGKNELVGGSVSYREMP